MLTNSLNLSPSSFLINPKIETGIADPVTTQVGQMFYRTDLNALRVYTNVGWESIVTQVTGTITIPYDLAFFLAGQMNYINSVSGAVLASRTITVAANAPGSIAKCGTAPLSTVAYTIAKNGTSVGSVVFTNGSTTGIITISSQVVLSAGDILTITTPGTIEPNISNVYVTLIGTAVA